MKKYKNAFVITGSIGSGKSTVCKILELYGFKVIDADAVNHQILDQIHQQIAQKFGEQYVYGGKVLRKELGDLVFNDIEKLKELEVILHPKIKHKITNLAQREESKNTPYFIDIPLYFENKNYLEFNKVLLVYAPQSTLIKRIMKRNSISKEEALNRINLQIDIDEKRKMSDFVICNVGNVGELNSEILNFIEALKNEYPDLKI